MCNASVSCLFNKLKDPDISEEIKKEHIAKVVYNKIVRNRIE